MSDPTSAVEIRDVWKTFRLTRHGPTTLLRWIRTLGRDAGGVVVREALRGVVFDVPAALALDASVASDVSALASALALASFSSLAASAWSAAAFFSASAAALAFALEVSFCSASASLAALRPPNVMSAMRTIVCSWRWPFFAR